MTLKILSDPKGILSDEPFVQGLDNIYYKLHECLDIATEPAKLEHVDLSKTRNSVSDVADGLVHILNSLGDLSGSFVPGLRVHLSSLNELASDIHQHLKEFESHYNEVVAPYNEVREELHQQFQEVNKLLEQVQYKNPNDALHQGHFDQDNYSDYPENH